MPWPASAHGHDERFRAAHVDVVAVLAGGVLADDLRRAYVAHGVPPGTRPWPPPHRLSGAGLPHRAVTTSQWPVCGGSVPACRRRRSISTSSLDLDGALVLVGEIDSYTAPVLGERLANGSPVEVIDLAGVSFIDSSGLRVLVEAHQAHVDKGARLVLRAPSAAVQRLLEISGLVGHLDVTA